MKLLALDTETHLIAPGLAAPPMVCTTWATAHDQGILHVKEAEEAWRRWLTKAAAGKLLLSNVTMHFDMAVALAQFPQLARLIFAAYEAGFVHCTTVDQRLIDIANGVLESKERPRATRMYNLKALAMRRLRRDVDKGEDTWRLRYKELEHLPCKKWPRYAREWAEEQGREYANPVKYAISDARNAYDIKASILDSEDAEMLRDNGDEAYASFALYLMSCRGIRTDGAACRKLITALEKEIDRCERVLLRKGLLRPNTKGKLTKDMKAARARLRASLPLSIQAQLDEAIAEAKAYSSKQARKQRDKVAFRFELDDSDFAKAERRLAKLLRKDISNAALIKKWRKYGYSEHLYVDLRSLVRKPRVFSALGVSVSKTGLISVNATACRKSGSKVLRALATYTSANVMRKKAQRLLKGSVIPLQTTYMSPINSGRVSSRASEAPLVGDNYQNFARSATHLDSGEELPGMRECIIPRPGFVFCSIDFDAAEMRSYAQIEYDHLGVSELRDVLNAGKNPHRVLGADILGISEKAFERRYAQGDPECSAAAQFAKIPNFALLGGGGYKILPDYAAGMGIRLELPQAKDLYEAFHGRWKHVKEMHKYLRTFIHKVYELPRCGFLRYLDRYAQACNNPFQALTAKAAKRACCHLAREQYVPGGSLNGSYSVLFMHDEVLFELVQDMASEHAWRATKIMIDAYNHFTPDVSMTATPALMSRFCKGAKTVTHETKRDKDGNKKLLIYVPKVAA